MRSVHLFLPGAAVALALSGCSERVIAVANDDILVVVDDIQRKLPLATASIHYVLADPQLLSDDAGPAERVVRMREDAEFDCAGHRWGERVRELTMLNGKVLTNQTPVPVFRTPSSGSVGESALRAVCEQDFYSTRGSRRPLGSIEKDYLKRVGDR